jgi:hypothetical protein
VYFAEIRSTISQAASPSSHSTTLPRTMTGAVEHAAYVGVEHHGRLLALFGVGLLAGVVGACDLVVEVGDTWRSVDLRCAHCGEPMHAGDVDPLPGPGAAV